MTDKANINSKSTDGEEPLLRQVDLSDDGKDNSNREAIDKKASKATAHPKKTKAVPGKTKSKAAHKAKTAKQPKPMPGDAEAKEINDLHDALTEQNREFAAESVARVVEIGTKLRAMKKVVGHGHWERWVKKCLKFDVRTASRYMGLANPKKTRMSDLAACSSLMNAYAAAGIAPKKATARAVPFKVFSPAAERVLKLPVEDMPEENKETLRAEFERLEPIALQFYEQPSIFTAYWQKKMTEPPVRWARKDVELFRAEVAKAQAILAELEKDAQFTDEPDTTPAQVEDSGLKAEETKVPARKKNLTPKPNTKS